MTAVLPAPAELALPPGRPAAIAALVADVAGAAAHLRYLGGLLDRPVAAGGSWQGSDAEAARRRIQVVRALVEAAAGTLEAAGARLARHRDLLLAARAAVVALRAEQEDDVVAVQRVLAGRALALPVAELADDPCTVAAVEEFAAAERRRRLQHERLLTEVADDAALTAVALTDSTAVYGSGGRVGDDRAAVVHLAALLPGWGDAELARRGSALAGSLVGESHTPEEMNALAADAAVFAGSPAFAGAFLAGLGAGGVELLLIALGMNRFGPPGPLADLLAAALRAVGPAPASRAAAEVVTARYVDPDDVGPLAGYTAAGMAAVLSAGARHGQVPAATVASWTRQLFVREHRMQTPTGIGQPPPGWPQGAGDPAAYALTVLADQGDPAAAASLLSSEDVWVAVVARAWWGHPAAAEVVALAGRADGGAARVALGLGLEVLGAGLADAHPDDWTANRDTVAALAGPLGVGLTAHVDVVAEPLAAAATGTAGTRDADRLRGLGLVALDDAGAAGIAQALAGRLDGWTAPAPDPAELLLSGAEVIGAFVAVQQYGQRLDHALDGFELQARAERAELAWNVLTLPLELLSGPVGTALGVLAGFTAIALDADGTWDEPPGPGRVLDRADAARAATTAPSPAALWPAAAERAVAAYERTTELLGRPRAPRSPREDYLAPLTDAIAPDGKGLRSRASRDTVGDD